MAAWQCGRVSWRVLIAFFNIVLKLQNSCGSVEGWQGLKECHMEMKLGGLMLVLCEVMAVWRGGWGDPHSLLAFSRIFLRFHNSCGSLEAWQGLQERHIEMKQV